MRAAPGQEAAAETVRAALPAVFGKSFGALDAEFRAWLADLR